MSREKLFAKLTGEDLAQVKDVVSMTAGIPQMSVNQMLLSMQQSGPGAPIFSAIYQFLLDVEQEKFQTYRIPGNSDMNIGIGLDLTANNPGAIAVLYAAVPDVNWEALFPSMLVQENLPLRALNSEQVKNLLFYTLVGASKGQYNFRGLTQDLVSKLAGCGLSNSLLTPVQLVALQSMAFNNPALIGNNLCDRLKQMLRTGNDGAPLMEIVECSNRNANVGLQNRRLKEAGLFHGVPEDVNLTLRAYRKLKAANKNIQLIGGVPNPYPVGDYAKKYNGNRTLPAPIPGASCNPTPDTTYFGTSGPDKIGVTSGTQQVGFAGDGDDVLFVTGDNSKKTVSGFDGDIYLAGNNGLDTYQLDKEAGNITVFDSDHNGLLKVYRDGDFQGIAQSTNSDNSVFNLKVGNELYTLTRAGSEMKILWGDQSNHFSLANFKAGGQYNLLLAHQPQLIKSSLVLPNSLVVDVNLITQGRYVFIVSIFDLNGRIINSYAIPLSVSNVYSDYAVSSAASDNSFSVCWYGTIGTGHQAIDTLNRILCNQNGVLGSQLIDSCASDSCNFNIIDTMSLSNNDFVYFYSRVVDGKQSFLVRTNVGTRFISQPPGLWGRISIGVHGRAFNSGFSVWASFCNEQNFCNNFIAIFDVALQLIDYISLGSPSGMASTGELSNGYILVFSDPTGLSIYTKVFKKDSGWGSSELLFTGDLSSSPVNYETVTLGNNNTLVSLVCYNWNTDIYTGYIVPINSNNQRIGQLYPIFGLVDYYSGSVTLKNGDTFVHYYDLQTNLIYGIYLETSGLQLGNSTGNSTFVRSVSRRESPQFVEVFSASKKTSADIVPVKNGSKFHPPRGNFSSVSYGSWDKDLKYDRGTGEPIFTYRVYDSNNTEVGTAEFYAHPLLCFSEDKQRNNVVKTTGVFNQLNLTESTLTDEICRALPPTLFDRVVMSAAHATAHGAIRGGANVVGFTLRSYNVPENIAYCVNQFTYYSAFFTMRFGINYYQAAGYDSASRSFVSFCKGAIETGEIMFANFAFNTLRAMFHKAGEALEKRSWPLSGKVAKVGGSIMRFGVFAFSAVQTSVYETTAALFAGAASELAVETSGTYVVSRCRSK